MPLRGETDSRTPWEILRDDLVWTLLGQGATDAEIARHPV
jgi:hypothetical protein